jgi:hypothetical protein
VPLLLFKLESTKSEPNSNFSLLVFFHGAGMAPVKARNS